MSKGLNEYEKMLQRYLMCSYAYYQRFESLVPDDVFDGMAKTLLKHYNEWQGHQHVHMVSKEDLEAGTLYALKDYPTMVVHAAERWIRE